MSNKIWNVITHQETPAFGEGDYDEYYEIVNERGDALQAIDYDGLEQIADALNGFGGNLRITTALEINLHCETQLQKMEIETLKAENSKMRQALELAELELKAIYPRLGFRSSNVLDTVTKTLAEL